MNKSPIYTKVNHFKEYKTNYILNINIPSEYALYLITKDMTLTTNIDILHV